MKSLYPPLDHRYPASALLLPAYYILFAAATLSGGHVVQLSIFALLAALSISSPSLTAGTISEDYSRGLPSFALLIFFLDLLILSEPGSIKFTGPQRTPGNEETESTNDEPEAIWQRIKTGLRLVATFRGIGWSFQVKGVPEHPNGNLPRRDFAIKYLLLCGQSWAYKTFFHYIMNIAVAGRTHSVSWTTYLALNALEGWAGAFWAAVGLNQFYRLAAAMSVGIVICEPWEWPPFFGDLSDGWSVRQIWSSVWHQLLRRILQQPGIGLARAIGLRKGTLGSSYLQLYTAFAISALLHEWCMFNAIHSDTVELWFFMTQPLAITLEGFVQWCWKELGHSEQYTRFATYFGYLWVFVWFSYCLPPFVQAQRGVGIMDGDLGSEWIKSAAENHVTLLMGR